MKSIKQLHCMNKIQIKSDQYNTIQKQCVSMLIMTVTARVQECSDILNIDCFVSSI